jgi:hypothetical protein
MANIITDEGFTIDHGENTSTRISDPFAPQRIEEILQKIEVGPDLTEDQHEQVRNLIREYADIFTVSLSEVQVVDWHKHHLNIDPSIKLPTCVSQRPVTEVQKDWSPAASLRQLAAQTSHRKKQVKLAPHAPKSFTKSMRNASSTVYHRSARKSANLGRQTKLC